MANQDYCGERGVDLRRADLRSHTIFDASTATPPKVGETVRASTHAASLGDRLQTLAENVHDFADRMTGAVPRCAPEYAESDPGEVGALHGQLGRIAAWMSEAEDAVARLQKL